MLEKRCQEDAPESKNEYSDHREVEKAFFEKGVYELLGSREYRIVQEGKIKGKRFDGLAISEIDSCEARIVIITLRIFEDRMKNAKIRFCIKVMLILRKRSLVI